MNTRKKVLIIGGGASGLMAAIAAARNGSDVIILEQLQRVGKKILATGNGRCNLSNVNTNTKRYHGENVSFMVSALKQFDVVKTLNFFEELGISCREEEEGKIYPWSGQASSVLDVLRYEIQRLNIEEKCETEVIKIIPLKNGFKLITKDGNEINGDSVIVATGGKASPNLGSTGSGYKMAANLGHNIIDPFPTLVQLKLNFQHLKAISGVKFQGTASIICEGNVLREEDGEILFTDYGISGPPIFQLSRSAGEKLSNNMKTYVRVDMFPEFSREEIMEIVKNKVRHDFYRPLDFCFVGLLNKKLIPVILKSCDITDVHGLCGNVTEDEINKISGILKKWEFEIIGTQAWRDAQATAGGIDVRKINEDTMESRLVNGLYFAGEVIDIDGDCGGFNLQWAWSSGYIAGLNASKKQD